MPHWWCFMFRSVLWVHFSALMLLIGWQEGHLPFISQRFSSGIVVVENQGRTGRPGLTWKLAVHIKIVVWLASVLVTTLCPKKTTLLCLAITLTYISRFDSFWQECCWESKQSNGTLFSYLTSTSMPKQCRFLGHSVCMHVFVSLF